MTAEIRAHCELCESCPYQNSGRQPSRQTTMTAMAAPALLLVRPPAVSLPCSPSSRATTQSRDMSGLKPLEWGMSSTPGGPRGRIPRRSFSRSSSLRVQSSTGFSEEEHWPLQCEHTQESCLESSRVQRRQIMGTGIAVIFSAVSLPIQAAEDQFTLYEDKEDKFSLLVPQEWTKGEGTTGTRKVTAFFPNNDSSSVNVNVVITGIAADYTALGSFGTVDIFAENLVNSLDRAWQGPKGQAAKLIDSRARNGMYYIEYTVQKPGEAKRHLLSVVGMASNGWINRLFTVTGQYWEEDAEKFKPSLQKVLLAGVSKK